MARARAYVLGRFPQDKELRGQALLIKEQLKSTEGEAKTVKEIADVITAGKGSGRLQTRQDPVRVVSFYMSVWKKKGWVKQVEVDRPDEEAAAVEAAENQPFHPGDDGTGASPAEREEAATEADVTIAHEEEQRPNLTGMKVSDAVMHVLERSDSNGVAFDEILTYLHRNGYEVKLNQVRSAISNLVGRDMVKKTDAGYARA